MYALDISLPHDYMSPHAMARTFPMDLLCWGRQLTVGSSDRRLRVFSLPKKPHLWPTPKLGLGYKCWMVFSMTWYRFSRANDVSEDRYHYEKWSHADSQGRKSWLDEFKLEHRRQLKEHGSFFFLSQAIFWLISIAILGSRAPFPAVHTCCDLYSK